ncbi:MAG: tellurite resistance TerB family protein [Rhodocyclaceae bacterium]
MMKNQDWKRLLEQGLAGTGLSQATVTGAGKGMFDKLMSSGVGGGLIGGVIGGMLAGKGGRKVAGSAVKLGSIAAIGALAYSAYNRYRQQQAPAGAAGEIVLPPEDSGFLPPAGDAVAEGAMRLAIVRAMIAAAKADGHIDDTERERIFTQITQLGLGAEEKAFLFDELAKPLDIDAIVRLGVTPELCAELYTASLLAIDPDTPAERAYLQMLAARLGLEQGLVDQIHAAVAAA